MDPTWAPWCAELFPNIQAPPLEEGPPPNEEDRNSLTEENINILLFETSKISFSDYEEDSDSDSNQEGATAVVGKSSDEVLYDVEMQSPKKTPPTAEKDSRKERGMGMGMGNGNEQEKEKEGAKAKAKAPEMSHGERKNPAGVTKDDILVSRQ